MIVHQKQQKKTSLDGNFLSRHWFLATLLFVFCLFPYSNYCESNFSPLRSSDSWEIIFICESIAGIFSVLLFYYFKKTTPPEKLGIKDIKTFLGFFLALMTMFSFPSILLIRPSILLLNAKLDQSEPETHLVFITGKKVRNISNKWTFSSTYRYIRFDDWGNESKFCEILVDRDFFEDINIRDQLKVVTGSGKFGFEWVENYKLTKPY